MSNGLDAALAKIDQNRDAALERLFRLLRIPSISTDPAFKQDCHKAASWMVEELASLGFQASLRPTTGHPMVVAHYKKPGTPRVLFYGHYDVQPVDPLNLWQTPPFEPRIDDGPNGRKWIVARGACDDKGQLMTFVEAARGFIEAHGELPLDVTVFLEGEEESGSPSLDAFLKASGEELKADLALVCDTGMWDKDTPAITATLRGMCAMEVTITCANRDLHSGLYGGAAQNPIRALTKILAQVHDDTGRVTIPGFYDGVTEPAREVKDSWQRLPFDTAEFLGEVGLSTPAGEEGRSALELLWSRPTCEFNGISGGYEGDGFKTVIASKASAKVSYRLVGEQDPIKLREAFETFVRDRLPPDCTASFIHYGASPALRLPFDSPALKKAKGALEDEWGTTAYVIGGGGSIPVVGSFKRALGMDSLLVGFGLDDDRVHSPNEKYELSSFHKGARSWARIMAALAAR
jgi:acetylornithine deacetylase/succinyl-diaminopimelate desuccinylase-like protein